MMTGGAPRPPSRSRGLARLGRNEVTRLDALAGGSTSQHNVPGQLHMPVVLGEFFVTLQ